MQKELQHVARLAKGSKWGRLLHDPIRYLNALWYNKIRYPQTKKGKLQTINTFFGVSMNVVLPAGTDLYLLGAKSHDSEIRLAKLMILTLQEGETFIDVGAHFGYFSLLASKLLGENGRVLSIEASKVTSEVLMENTKRHKNITTKHLACTDTDQLISFYEFPVLYSEYNTLSPEQFEEADWIKTNPPKEIQVEGKRLDHLIEELHLHPRFIKIDVEGAELQVISGMEVLLQKESELYIVMEFLQDERGNAPHFAAAKRLASFDFLPFIIQTNGELKAISASEIPSYLKTAKLESDNIVFKQINH